MKKSILIYSAIIYIVCFIINVVDIFTSSFNFETLFLMFFSILCLLPIYFIFEEKYLKKAFVFLWIVNLIQSFSVILLGLTYKLIIGPDLSLYLINSGDKLVQFSVKIFNIFSYFNYIKGDNTFAIGINFSHLLLFIYFYFEAKKYKKTTVKSDDTQ